MNHYRIPHTDLLVSRLAYGCMTIGGAWGKEALSAEEIRKATAAVEAAVEVGINFFDHADIYARGDSERVFGEILGQSPGLRDRIIIQTKCGIRFRDDPVPGSPPRYDFSYEHIVASVEGSLRRLGIEQVELLLLHRPDPLVEPEDVARAFDALHAAGKVRYFGVSNHGAEQIRLLRTAVAQPLVVNQLELSLIHMGTIDAGVGVNQGAPQSIAAGLLDFCRREGILVQAWSPVAGGALFAPPADADPTTLAAAEVVRELAAARETTPEAIVLAWLLRHPAGIQPIIGTTNPERVRASALADDVSLSREEWYRLFVASRGGTLP